MFFGPAGTISCGASRGDGRAKAGPRAMLVRASLIVGGQGVGPTGAVSGTALSRELSGGNALSCSDPVDSVETGQLEPFGRTVSALREWTCGPCGRRGIDAVDGAATPNSKRPVTINIEVLRAIN